MSSNLLKLNNYVMPAINSVRKSIIFAVVNKVFQNAQNLVILRCCLADNGKEMYKEL